jgi:hypothetical protein
MDHHCPWINNCVGYFNHAHFVRFLVSVDAACGMLIVTLGFRVHALMSEIATHSITYSNVHFPYVLLFTEAPSSRVGRNKRHRSCVFGNQHFVVLHDAVDGWNFVVLPNLLRFYKHHDNRELGKGSRG